MENFNIVYPRMPWWVPSGDADWFDYVANATINNNSATLINFTLPDTDRGVIRWFGQTILQSGMDNLVTWNILVNGGPDRVYGSIVGLISTTINPTETLIRLPKGSQVQLNVSTINIGNIDVIGRLKGWSWTEI